MKAAWTTAIWLFTIVLKISAAEATQFSTSELASGTAHKTQIERVEFAGHPALRVISAEGLTEGDEDRLVIMEHDFTDGSIEVMLSGDRASSAGAGARGFVGIAFRIHDNVEEFEAIYLRPTNARADDQKRRNHSTQYISYPDYPWHRLRRETPGKYEAYVDLVPGTWTQVKLVIQGERAELYLHGQSQPTLIVKDLKRGASSGNIGLWIGPGTVAHFRDLVITDA